MWPFGDPFEQSLRRAAERTAVLFRGSEVSEGDTMSSIGADPSGFYAADSRSLGSIAGLILAQAAYDGAQRIKLHYGNNRMIFTIDGVDHDMVPCPPRLTGAGVVAESGSAARPGRG